jgi:outer membrane protein, multidrug efflux system
MSSNESNEPSSPKVAPRRTRLSSQMLPLLFASAFLACSANTAYERPALTLPAAFRGAPESASPGGTASSLSASSAASLADQRWWALFDDERLRALIQTAVENNLDLELLAARVLEARSQLGVAKADQLPSVGADLSGGGSHTVTGGTFYSDASLSLGVSASWELDFWGKFRSASEAARARVLASEWGRRAALTSLISQVAGAYFQLRALDRQRDIAERALVARRQSLQLTEWRERSGAGSLLDVRQAEQLVHGASGELIELDRQIALRENGISTLLGRAPGPVARGQGLDEQRLPPELPAGLPSALLARRPDIQAAESLLMSSHAEVGVAKAQLFPQIALNGSGGVLTSALTGLLSAPALIGSLTGSVLQPLFDGGRRRAEITAADARERQALITYRQTIVQALREVSDALIGYQRGRELRTSREALLHSTEQARALAALRYQAGSSSYLEVLDSDSRRLEAEFGLVDARLAELLCYVDLYRALGGGWQT